MSVSFYGRANTEGKIYVVPSASCQWLLTLGRPCQWVSHYTTSFQAFIHLSLSPQTIVNTKFTRPSHIKPLLLADSYFYILSKSLIFILLNFSFRVLQAHIFNMIQQWLLKIGNEINNGNIELQRHVCTCRDLLG